MCALRRLGPPLLGKDTESIWNVKGRSQADIPTKTIVSSSKIFIDPAPRLTLKTDGKIIFPDSQKIHSGTYQRLTPSMIKLGRFIENLDRPSEAYFNSELSSYLEGAVWDQSVQGHHLFSRIHNRDCYLDTEAIRFRWSICSHRNMNPVFAKSFDKQLLTEWMSDRKAAFLITAYQSYVNAYMGNLIWKQKDPFKSFQDRVLSVSPLGKSIVRALPCKLDVPFYPSHRSARLT